MAAIEATSRTSRGDNSLLTAEAVTPYCLSVAERSYLYKNIERIIDLLFDKKVIVNCDRDPYLLRWYVIRTAKFAIFIHKFIRSDEDRALHDHPWNFIVIPIWRGYHEHYKSPRPSGEVYEGCRRVLPIIGARFRRATYRHRVELLRAYGGIPSDPRQWYRELPSWSFFIRFKEFREWGFHTHEGWIQWNKWWQEKCE